MTSSALPGFSRAAQVVAALAQDSRQGPSPIIISLATPCEDRCLLLASHSGRPRMEVSERNRVSRLGPSVWKAGVGLKILLLRSAVLDPLGEDGVECTIILTGLVRMAVTLGTPAPRKTAM